MRTPFALATAAVALALCAVIARAAAPAAPAGRPLSPAERAAMTGPVWRTGCPVTLDDLAVLDVPFTDDAGQPRVGRLVVHRDEAAPVAQAMAAVHAARFPLRSVDPIERFAGDDDASMAADNTSAFNCRPVAGGGTSWSAHAYGRAIDINPLRNPFLTRSGRVMPPGGAAFLDRAALTPGLIRPGEAVVRAFSAIGWRWGGDWTGGSKDYQHFSRSGR
jgi:hypothetical protein